MKTKDKMSYKNIFEYVLLIVPASSIKTWVLRKCTSSDPFSWNPPSDNQMLDSLQIIEESTLFCGGNLDIHQSLYATPLVAVTQLEKFQH